jgi:hypothetical protein
MKADISHFWQYGLFIAKNVIKKILTYFVYIRIAQPHGFLRHNRCRREKSISEKSEVLIIQT